MLEGIDWALDPNGDGDISDAMDVVNLSIGSPYGQEQDDTTLAIDNAVRAGVVAVLSAGNNADRPFIVGSPSTAARAISVAQTALPDDKLQTIETDKGITVRNSRLQTWSTAAERRRSPRRWCRRPTRRAPPRAARRRTSPTSRPARSR